MVNNIKSYYDKLSLEQKNALLNLRKIILEQTPDSVETFSYGMPCFKYKNKYLICIGAFKNHMSIFPGGEATEAFKDDLKKFKTSKGTIQFTTDNKISSDLLIKIIKHRVESIESSLNN
jgi:uncharacterized protein YdhG (YjbR/CyaY superfamily)